MHRGQTSWENRKQNAPQYIFIFFQLAISEKLTKLDVNDLNARKINYTHIL